MGIKTQNISHISKMGQKWQKSLKKEIPEIRFSYFHRGSLCKCEYLNPRKSFFLCSFFHRGKFTFLESSSNSAYFDTYRIYPTLWKEMFWPQRCICIMDPLKGPSLQISSCSSLHRPIGAANTSSYVMRNVGGKRESLSF
jgi:hypothetical protein